MADAAVLWDFDRTLAYRAATWSGCLVEAIATIDPEHGLVRDDLVPWLRGGLPWHRPELGHPHLETADAWWDALHPLFRAAYVQTGVDESVAAHAAHAFRSCYIDPARWTVFPDATAVLDELAAAGWAHVIVSNHVPELEELISALGFARQFTAIVNSAIVGWEKPNRRIFEAALSRAGPRPSAICRRSPSGTHPVNGLHISLPIYPPRSTASPARSPPTIQACGPVIYWCG